MELKEVDMDGCWACVSEPDYLVTYGVSTCIAIAVGHDAKRKAWLIHSPAFGHEIGPLVDMLTDATGGKGLGKGLTIWVCGGASTDEACDDEANLAREAVKEQLKKLAANAAIIDMWLAEGNVEVMYRGGKWVCSVSGSAHRSLHS